MWGTLTWRLLIWFLSSTWLSVASRSSFSAYVCWVVFNGLFSIFLDNMFKGNVIADRVFDSMRYFCWILFTDMVKVTSGDFLYLKPARFSLLPVPFQESGPNSETWIGFLRLSFGQHKNYSSSSSFGENWLQRVIKVVYNYEWPGHISTGLTWKYSRKYDGMCSAQYESGIAFLGRRCQLDH